MSQICDIRLCIIDTMHNLFTGPVDMHFAIFNCTAIWLCHIWRRWSHWRCATPFAHQHCQPSFEEESPPSTWLCQIPQCLLLDRDRLEDVESNNTRRGKSKPIHIIPGRQGWKTAYQHEDRRYPSDRMGYLTWLSPAQAYWRKYYMVVNVCECQVELPWWGHKSMPGAQLGWRLVEERYDWQKALWYFQANLVY